MLGRLHLTVIVMRHARRYKLICAKFTTFFKSVELHVNHGFPWRHVTSRMQFPSVTVLCLIPFSPVSSKCDGFRCVPYLYAVFAVTLAHV